MLQSSLLKLGADCQSALPWFCLAEWSSNSTASVVRLLTLLISLTIENPKFSIVIWHCEKSMTVIISWHHVKMNSSADQVSQALLSEQHYNKGGEKW